MCRGRGREFAGEYAEDQEPLVGGHQARHGAMQVHLAATAWRQQQWFLVFVTLNATSTSPLHDHLVEDELADRCWPMIHQAAQLVGA